MPQNTTVPKDRDRVKREKADLERRRRDFVRLGKLDYCFRACWPTTRRHGARCAR